MARLGGESWVLEKSLVGLADHVCGIYIYTNKKCYKFEELEVEDDNILLNPILNYTRKMERP